jgi:hypothetical protein
LAIVMGVVSGQDWATCRAVFEDRVPGAVAQAVKDADTSFGIELHTMPARCRRDPTDTRDKHELAAVGG